METLIEFCKFLELLPGIPNRTGRGWKKRLKVGPFIPLPLWKIWEMA